MTDLIVEITRSVAVTGLFIYLVLNGRKNKLNHDRGWSFILAGFALLSFGMLIDITDNFKSLSTYIIIGETETQSIIEKFVGYLGGFILLTLGFFIWLPHIIEVRRTREELRILNSSLEDKVRERTEELTAANKMLKRKQSIIDIELELAREVQLQIIPDTDQIMKDTGISAVFHPHGKISGDLFDIREFENKIFFFIADVSGHGVPAALISMMVKQAYNRLLKQNYRPAALLTELNRELYPMLNTSSYITAQFAILSKSDESLLFASAGHRDLIIYKSDEQTVYRVNTDGFLIGIEPDARFFEDRISFSQNDILLMYTDCLVETQNKNDEDFTTERVTEILRTVYYKPASEITDQLTQTLYSFAGKDNLDDDLTIIAYKAGDLSHTVDSTLQKATRFIRSRDYANAVKSMKHLIATSEKNPELQLKLAGIYYLSEDYRNARLFTEQVLRAEPSSDKARKLLKKIHKHSRKRSK